MSDDFDFAMVKMKERLTEIEHEADKNYKWLLREFAEMQCLRNAAEAEAARLREALEDAERELRLALAHGGDLIQQPMLRKEMENAATIARAALSPVAVADPLTVCPHADGNTCEQYRLQGMRCQTCPWMRAAGEG